MKNIINSLKENIINPLKYISLAVGLPYLVGCADEEVKPLQPLIFGPFACGEYAMEKDSVKFPGNPLPSKTFYIEGDFAYLPSGNSLQIIDITDKANPTMVGGSFAKGDVTNVFVVGDNAYITYTVRDENYQTKESGIQIIDITNKSAPVVVTGIETPGETLGLFVEGDYAYIGAGPV